MEQAATNAEQEQAQQPSPQNSKDLDTIANQFVGDAAATLVGYLKEKVKRQNIINYNGANMAYTHGKDIAQKLRLGDVYHDIAPFPSRTEINVEAPPAKPSEAGLPIPKWAISTIASLLTGSALTGGGLALYNHYFGEVSGDVSEVNVNMPPGETSQGTVGLTVE